MCVAPPDERQAALLGEATDAGGRLRPLAVDFDGVERGVRLPDGAVPERVRDDRRTPAGVGDVDDLLGESSPSSVSFGGDGPTTRT
nr:hypothetical protein [Salinigranum rubrum]